MLPSAQALEEIRQHAQDALPFECCGIIDGEGVVHRCENVAANRYRYFRILTSEIRAITRRKGLLAVYHSHVDVPVYISSEDYEGFHGGAAFYIIVSSKHGVVGQPEVFEPVGPRPTVRFRRVK